MKIRKYAVGLKKHLFKTFKRIKKARYIQRYHQGCFENLQKIG